MYFKVQDMEEDSSDEDDVSPPGDTHKSKEPKPRDSNNMQPPPLPPTPGNVVVKKGYDPKQHCKWKNVIYISTKLQYAYFYSN